MYCRGGNGGRGCYSFLRENYGSRIPDGGSGGSGGDLYFRSTSRLSSLFDLRRAHFEGNHGKIGRSKKRDGESGKTKYISLPLGTEVYLIKKNEKDENKIMKG